MIENRSLGSKAFDVFNLIFLHYLDAAVFVAALVYLDDCVK